MISKKCIPNPNKLTDTENEFLKDNKSSSISLKSNKTKYKGRMISMSDSFYEELNDFLQKNPTEGNRSSFIVRIVANYINNKKNI